MCGGIVTPSGGVVLVDGHHNQRAYRVEDRARPAELTTDAFETVWNAVSFSRGLFGKPPNPAYVEKVLKALSLWDKKDNKIMTLSGGMKRRLLIAKALAHEPTILFLDEPTAGVDVELRKDMWQVVRDLRASGVTIILTTHYIEEAELMADRVGVIAKGELILVENKAELMRKLGKKQLSLVLSTALQSLPPSLQGQGLELAKDGHEIIYTYDSADSSVNPGADPSHPGARRADLVALLRDVEGEGIDIKDLHTTQRSLEDIFVDLVRDH